MRKILDFKGFLLESQGTHGMSLDDAISLASSSPNLSQEFMDLLKSPFAKKFSQDPYEIVSTPRQIKNGTFLFSMKGSMSSRAVGIFGNGYIRTVPFGGASGVSHVIINYRDLVHMKESGLFQLKSSMPELKGNIVDEILSGKMYHLLSKFIEKKLDTEASPENFPKFKRGLDIEDRPILTFVDKSGNDLGSFHAKSIDFTTSAYTAIGEGLMMVNDLSVKNKNIRGAFVDPKTVAELDMKAVKSSFVDCTFLPKQKCYITLKNSTVSNTLIDTEMSGICKVELQNTKMEDVNITSSYLSIDAKDSDLGGLTIKNTHRSPTDLFVSLNNCSVKGLKLNEGKLEGIKKDYKRIALHLDGIRIADSEDLKNIVLQALNEGPGYISTGNRLRDYNEKREGLGYVIENCDFSGVSLSSINPANWTDKINLLHEFINKNNNISLSDSEFGTKVERVVKVRNLFNK